MFLSWLDICKQLNFSIFVSLKIKVQDKLPDAPQFIVYKACILDMYYPA